ncbi:hypothetical protein CI1B_20510 [Bradyrhizobium ivorense]|uniref:Xaa-Pro dipeptidyl-peptidase-like domain-containing protein n=1 Tax=Bradyrhizobium ivorense TaxID=2511166 RepID=A0A508SYX1_9BRAD|nr:CocE/NonD family hydrolase [Bradyrhizobium ivorense]VIO68295.1 hypothetical protein CI1B_20510 [Bradyrhizobium ivorense]
MFAKQDVRFPAEGGITLSSWLFLPTQNATRLPAVSMAHGYGGTKYHGIEPMAEAFAEAGFAVLLHDHHGFGDSGGEPRHDINPWQQIGDWRRAVSYLQDRPEVDESHVGGWETSFAGGHAIVLGATDRQLKAVVSQIPTIDGHAAGLRRVAPEAVAALEAQFAVDERAQMRGEPPATQVIVSDEVGKISSYKAADCRLLPSSPPGWSLGEQRDRALDAVGADVRSRRFRRAGVAHPPPDAGLPITTKLLSPISSYKHTSARWNPNAL